MMGIDHLEIAESLFVHAIQEKKIKKRERISTMKRYYRKIKYFILLDIILYGVSVLSTAYMSILLIRFIDRGYQSEFMKIIFLYAFAIGIHLLTAYLCNLLQWVYGNRFRLLLSEDYFTSVIQQQPTDFYSKPAQYYTEFHTQDLKAIEADYLMPMLSILKCIMTLLINFLVLKIYIQEWILFVVMFLALVSLLIPKITAKSLAKRRDQAIEQMKKFQLYNQDLLRGYNWINNRTKAAFQKENRKQIDEQLEKDFRYGKCKSAALVMNAGANMMIILVAIILVGIELKNGRMSFGVASSLMMNIATFVDPFAEITYCINALHTASTLKDRFLHFVNNHQTPLIKQKATSGNQITMEHIDYQIGTYQLKIEELIFEKGKKYLIVGENGAGKSTLLNLLGSQLLDYEGSVKIDGMDIRAVDCTDWIAYLRQSDHLFLSDYENNVTLFNSYPLQVNKLISNDKIRRNKNREGLSGGEQKFVLLDRIFNMDRAFILLDEPFAELSEEAKQEYYAYFMQKPNTIIMISHDQVDHSLFDVVVKVKKENNCAYAYATHPFHQDGTV